jgi:hypothetical protein
MEGTIGIASRAFIVQKLVRPHTFVRAKTCYPNAHARRQARLDRMGWELLVPAAGRSFIDAA